MTAMRKSMARAAEYRRLAIAAGALAETSLLANVREKHEQAAAKWTALAILGERPIQPRPAQAGKPRFPRVDGDAPCIA